MRMLRLISRRAAAATMAGLTSVSCGVSSRPLPLGNEFAPEVDASAEVEDATLHLTAQVPTCSLGPEGGVCECVDQPIVGEVPNIYFVLDRSGSMADTTESTTGMSKWATVRGVIAQMVVDLGPRANFGVAVFPNPRDNGCSAGVEVFAPRRGDAPAGTIGPADTQFITVLGAIAPNGGTPTAATFTALESHLQSLPGKTYVILATDGGPNCDSTLTCAADECQLNIEEVAGCPSGGPPNCCAPASGGTSDNCEDTAATVNAVLQLQQVGIPVYVVGVPASEPYADVLNQLAVAGGTARSGEDAGDAGGRDAPLYYAVSGGDPADLQVALSSIAGQITGTCSFDLGSPPADPTLVNVFFDNVPVAQMGPDGWSLSGSQVTILGASCQEVLTGGVLDVRVVAGCPTVEH
jgi:hypothetical protein